MESISNYKTQISDKESILTAIATNLPEGMIYRLITKGTEYRKFVYLSGSFQKMYGHTPEEGMADPTLIFHSVLRADVQSLFDAEAESTRTLTTFKCEVRMINPDGTIRTSRFVSTPTLMDDGSICWDGIELDITDLKKIETDLQYNQFLLKSITEGLPDRIFAKDLKGNFLFTNSAVTKYIDDKPDEILGKSNTTIFPLDEANKTLSKDLEIMESGEIQTFEEQLTTSGKTTTFLTTKGPLKDAHGNIIGLFGIARDISELKKAKEDLRQNQFLLQSITEGLPDSIFAKDLNGNYIFLNSAFAKRAYKKPEELIGKDNRDVISLEEARKATEMDLEVIETEKTLTIEHKVTTASGEIMILTTKGPIKDAEGKVVGIFGIARDITELREREEALRVSEEKFEFAFNSSPNAILIRDEQTGKCLATNIAVTNIFGYDKEEVLGKTTLELNMYKDPACRDRIYEIMNEQGHIRNMEVIFYDKYGKHLFTLLTIERHYIEDKPVLYINIQDITERKQVELELQKLNLDKDRFVSILGHDLRGPVNGIVGLLELMQMDDMSIEEIKEINNLVYQSAKNTSGLLEDVLLWATAQSGKMKFNPEKINFKESCSSVIELVQSSANAKNISIELYSDNSLEVNADKNMLDTVLRNLISNSIKFTKEDGKIIVSAGRNLENTIISVIDNGVGINTKDIDKIFDKSLLFTSIGTNEEKGTGFGLKLCQDFIEKHQGKIWVESEEGKGTTFNFSLPNAS